ncbi:MAG: hypothetical protein LBM13_01060 [Candidatus Ancillula sp.]|nr:hypothetical protein [Candidatus Ancillula sp.]
MAIINYYEKYGFSQTDELDKIQWLINQKITDEENDSFGEGHSDKLFVLQLAKEAFATADSKAKYDQDLADSLKKRDPDGERKVSFDKWYGDAKTYWSTDQYDLAKTAIDRAMQYSTPETADSDFYNLAAGIYMALNLYSQSLDLINQSIVISPDEPKGYFIKCNIIYASTNQPHLDNDKKREIFEQLKNNCELMIKKAITKGSEYKEASRCYEMLAEIHYFDADYRRVFTVSGYDNVLAEKYALKAIAMSNGSDSDCPDARSILDDISERRHKVSQAEKSNADLNAKLKRETGELLNKSTDLIKTVYELKDSINNKTTFGDVSFGGEIWVGIIAGIVGLIALGLNGTGFGAFCIFVSIAVFGIRGAIISNNKRIRDTLASIDKYDATIKSVISERENMTNSINDLINRNNNEIKKQSAGLAPQPQSLEDVAAELSIV